MTCYHCLDDMAHLPHRLPYPHGCTCSVTWHWQFVDVVIHVHHEGYGQSIMAGGSDGYWQKW